MSNQYVLECVARYALATHEAQDTSTLRLVVAPAINSLCWAGFPNVDLLRQLNISVASWDASIADLAISCLLHLLASNASDNLLSCRNAYELARLLGGEALSSTKVAESHFEMASALGLPASPMGYRPGEFLSKCLRAQLGADDLARYFASAKNAVLLGSRGGSLKPMASALRSWARFSDAIGQKHFPIEASRVVQYAALFRDHGTFGQYVASLRAACEIVGEPIDWSKDTAIARARNGIKQAKLVHKGPRLALTGPTMRRIAVRMDSAIEERFFCVLSWVFLLRASNEASYLTRARDVNTLCDLFRPIQCHGIIGLVDDRLVIRLSSRKNRLGGDSIHRSCACATASGTSAHLYASICPVHVLWPWIVSRVQPGGRLFHEKIAQTAITWLRIALEARDVANASKFTLHSLRRGGAQALIQSGGDLATLLLAGGWRSCAFKSYLDLVGVEDSVVTASISTLLDLDEE